MAPYLRQRPGEESAELVVSVGGVPLPVRIDPAAALRLIRHLAEFVEEAASVPAAPDDGTCVRCGAAPRNAIGLCATCADEDAYGLTPES